MRLIDLEELLKFPIRLDNYDKKNGNKHFVFGIESVLEYAENLPTVDAVEVVRCKNCKHFTLNFVENVDGVPLIVAHEICSFWGDGCKTSQEGFCSFGERKDED